MTIAFRPAEPDDAPFVVSTWSRNYKYSRQAGVIASDDWERVMHPQLQKVIARPDARTIIAYESDDPTFFYGWICGDAIAKPPVVFFVYVKETFRRAGCARGLFAELGIDPARPFLYAYWTPMVLKLIGDPDFPEQNKIPFAKHEPNVARYPKREPRRVETWKR